MGGSDLGSDGVASRRYDGSMARVRSRDLGVMGERVAALFLEQRGARVVGRNVFVDRDEIDIVYRRTDGLVAVEVKTATGLAEPFDALNNEKMHRIRRAIAGYGRPIVAIDAIGVGLNDERVEIRWLRGIG